MPNIWYQFYTSENASNIDIFIVFCRVERPYLSPPTKLPLHLPRPPLPPHQEWHPHRPIKRWKTLPMVTGMYHVTHTVQSNAGRHCQWLQVCIMWLTLSNQMLEDIANGYRYVSCDTHCPIKHWKTLPMVTGMYHVTHTVQSNAWRHCQ